MEGKMQLLDGGPTREYSSANCMCDQDEMGWILPYEDLNILQSILSVSLKFFSESRDWQL